MWEEKIEINSALALTNIKCIGNLGLSNLWNSIFSSYSYCILHTNKMFEVFNVSYIKHYFAFTKTQYFFSTMEPTPNIEEWFCCRFRWASYRKKLTCIFSRNKDLQFPETWMHIRATSNLQTICFNVRCN